MSRMIAGMGMRAGCGVLLMALALASPAEEDAVDVAPGPARYSVEVIVFRNLDQRGVTPETPAPASIPSAPLATATAWPAIETSALQLAPVAARLKKSGAYQVLWYGGWVQPVERQERAILAALPAEASSAGLAGGVMLYRERYLHALVDVALALPDGSPDALKRVRQGRRLRGQAMQYFDSPALGVILVAKSLDAQTPGEPSGTVTAPTD
jgi:hypothetical protein